MVEAVWSETPRTSLTLSSPTQTTPHPTPQYLQINYGNTGSISRRESLLSPSAGRRAKQQRCIAGKFMFNISYQFIHIDCVNWHSTHTFSKQYNVHNKHYPKIHA